MVWFGDKSTLVQLMAWCRQAIMSCAGAGGLLVDANSIGLVLAWFWRIAVLPQTIIMYQRDSWNKRFLNPRNPADMQSSPYEVTKPVIWDPWQWGHLLNPRSPCLQTWIYFNPTWIGNHMIGKNSRTLLIHSQTSTMKPLKFGNP